jgi:sigma-B regulation protein RsbU (phosphoserine phosphatase)
MVNQDGEIEKLSGKVLRLKERLNQRDLKLKSILDFTDAINNNARTEELLRLFANTVEHDLRITKLLFLALVDETWSELLVVGTVNDIPVSRFVQEFVGMTHLESVESSDKAVFEGWSLFIPVMHESRPLAYVLVGDQAEADIGMSPTIKHMRLIQTLSNIISVAIQNKTLYEKSLEQERMKAELHLAAQMQSLMVSTGRIEANAYEIATYYKPHQQVGGDFFDFIEIDENNCFFCIADVSGKGVSAAFLMANIQAHIKAFLKFADWSLEKMVFEINNVVNSTAKGERFVTMFIGTYSSETRELQYINAGHNPPVILNGDQIELLNTGTVGLGMLEEIPFVNLGSLHIKNDSYLACYTDGVVEIENAAHEEYGTDNLAEVLRSSKSKNLAPEDLVTEIIHSLDMHRGSNPYFDDTALLCIRFL